MLPARVAEHFARIRKVCDKYINTELTQTSRLFSSTTDTAATALTVLWISFGAMASSLWAYGHTNPCPAATWSWCFQLVENPCKKTWARGLWWRNEQQRNEISTVCDLLQKSYCDSVVHNKILGVFRSTGLWVSDTRGPDHSHIKPLAYTTYSSPGSLASSSAMTGSFTPW